MTSFDVFPCSEKIPSFEEVLRLGTRYVNGFLKTYDIPQSISLDVGLCFEGNLETRTAVNVDGPCWWLEDQDACFYIRGFPGGTLVQAKVMNPNRDDVGTGTLKYEIAGKKAEGFLDSARQSHRIRRFWTLNRNGGQPATINLAYGMIAAALATLTSGFIYSGDGAWDYRQMPAWPDDFRRWYFRPELADDPNLRKWSLRCIESMREGFKSMP